MKSLPDEPGLSDQQRKTLMEVGQEHHLFINEQGQYELVPYDVVKEVGNKPFMAYTFERLSQPGDTYVLIWALDEAVELTLPVSPERLAVMRPFGKQRSLRTEGDKSVIEIGNRTYLVFRGMDANGVRDLLRAATARTVPSVVDTP